MGDSTSTTIGGYNLERDPSECIGLMPKPGCGTAPVDAGARGGVIRMDRGDGFRVFEAGVMRPLGGRVSHGQKHRAHGPVKDHGPVGMVKVGEAHLHEAYFAGAGRGEASALSRPRA